MSSLINSTPYLYHQSLSSRPSPETKALAAIETETPDSAPIESTIDEGVNHVPFRTALRGKLFDFDVRSRARYSSKAGSNNESRMQQTLHLVAQNLQRQQLLVEYHTEGLFH